MAITLEILDGTTLDLSTTASRKVVRGIITGLTVTTDPDPETIWSAITQLTSAGITLGSSLSGHTALILNRIFVRGYTNDGVLVDLVYENPTFGGPPSAYIIRTRASMSSRTGNCMYLDGQVLPIEILEYTDPDTGEKTTSDYVMCQFLTPTQEFSVSKLVYGVPSESNRMFHGRVNNAPWQGLPRGYWLISNYALDSYKYSGYYTEEIGASSRVICDWSEWAILRHDRTGKYIKVSAAHIAEITTYAYNPGYIFQSDFGFTRFGPYPLASFPLVFGF